MRVLKRVRLRDGLSLRVLLEEADDVWFLYNFVAQGDKVSASTIRKVQKETASGGVASEAKRVTLSIKVSSCEFEGTSARLRISGHICEETPYAKMSAHHTLEVGVTDEVCLVKEEWDAQHEEQMKEATNAAGKAEALVLLLQAGLANLLCVSSQLSRRLALVEMPLPKNRNVYSGYAKALSRFFKETADALYLHVDWGLLKALVIGGPGFYKDQFLEYLLQDAQQQGRKQVLQKRDLIFTVHASSAYRHALNELLSNPKEVRRAAECGAIQILMVSEALLRSPEPGQRRSYVQLLQKAAAAGAETLTFSDQHSTGEQLALLGGIAAILRFPLMEEAEEMEACDLRESKRLAP
ncbi:cell division related protein [Cyclospora cayetanensis]|uniref:Eukaryotic peptide chain release factor subunit 1 n=1 Tax=Cyclospora cayetanensis TaxID=88456 RepID=A0A1D3CSI9_9EIME|nr:cell division related protein [Cyclospora cayetanensis]